MSAKGAWARKGGAELFPQKAPASEKQQLPSAPKAAVPKAAAPKSVNSKSSENMNSAIVSQQETVNEDVNAESLATFFVSEQKFSVPRTIENWNAYLTDLWERLRRDNGECSISLKAFVRERFEEIIGWTGTEFVASQVISPRQLEILFGVLLNHLSEAQNYESNFVVDTNVSLTVGTTKEKKLAIPNLQIEVLDSNKSDRPAKSQEGGKSSNHHERKGRGRQSRGRGSNGNRSSNNSGGGTHSPGVQFTGKVTRWGSQGFGFIKPDDGGEDLHVNSSDLVGDYNALIVGRRVVFTKRFNERARKYKACRVSGEACTTTNTSSRSHQRRPRRRHHRGGNGGYGDNNNGGGGSGNGNGNYGSNSVNNAGVGFSVGSGGYGGVPYAGVHYGGVPYSFGAFPGGGHFGYGGGVQMPPISPTGAPGYGSPPYGGMNYGGPPISPVTPNPNQLAGSSAESSTAAGTAGGPISSDDPAPTSPAAP